MKGFGYWIGWVGILFIVWVSPAQGYKILTTGQTEAVSVYTYIFLTCGLICYLIHAIHIKAKVFIVAQIVNLITTVAVLVLLLRG